jgi:hypothetical protein
MKEAPIDQYLINSRADDIVLYLFFPSQNFTDLRPGSDTNNGTYFN